MANTYTTRFSMTKPEVGADTNAWGGHLNSNFDTIDTNMVSLTLTTTQTMAGALALPANGLNVGSGQLQVTGGNVSTSGNVSGVNGSFSGTLGVTGAATLSSTLAVTGSATFSSTMSVTGAVTASTAPTIGGHLTNKTYVDAQDALKLNLTGGTLTGNLSIVNSTTEMTLTLGSSGGYYYGNATTAGFKNSGGANRVSWDISTGDFTAAGGITGTNVTATTAVVSDTISERTSAAGVTIDGVLCKDSQVAPANRVITAGSTVTATGGSVTLASGLPNWVKRITVNFKGVSLNSGQNILIQLGTSGGVVTVGYQATSNRMGAAGTNNSTSTGGFIINNSDAGFFFNGAMQICAIDTPARGWVSSHSGRNDGSFVVCGGGDVTLAADLTSVTAVTTGGASFDNGSINIFYE